MPQSLNVSYLMVDIVKEQIPQLKQTLKLWKRKLMGIPFYVNIFQEWEWR